MSATRVAQEFSPGSAKWIRLGGCIEWVTETPFTADVSICFPLPAFSPLPSFLFPASVQYTMVAVIRCNGGEWVGGVSLRVAGTGRYRSERGGEVGWRDSREFFKKSTTNERTNERRNAMHTRGEDEKEWGKKERKKGRREKEEELQKFLRFNARGAPAWLMKTVT